MNKLKHIALISGFIPIFLFFSCRSNASTSKTSTTAVQKDTIKNDTSDPADKKPEINYLAQKFKKATIIDMRNLDGCQYLLELDSTHWLEPINLREDFKKNKLPVWVKYVEVHDLASICMAGQMVKIVEIIERK